MSAALFVTRALRRASRRHPLRALAAVAGIVLGTALTTMVTSVDGAVSRAVRSADAASLVRADVAVRARSSGGFSYAVGRRIRAAAGAATTLAVVQANAQVVTTRGRAGEPFYVLGVSPEATRFFSRFPTRRLFERRAAAGAPGLFVGTGWLHARGLHVGDRITLTTPRGDWPWTIVGALPGELPQGGAIAVAEIEAVGFAFRRSGSIDALYVRSPTRSARPALIRRMRAAAGTAAVVGPPAIGGQVGARSLAIVRSLLLVAGAIGLLSSAVVVFVCWRLLLEDERASLARLRLTGATPGQLAVGAAVLLFPVTLACGAFGVPLGFLGGRLVRGLSAQLVAFTGLAALPNARDATGPALVGLGGALAIAVVAWAAAIRAFVRTPALEAVRPPDPPPPARAPRLPVAAVGALALVSAAAAIAHLPTRLTSISLALAIAGATLLTLSAPSLLGRGIAARGGFLRLAAGRHVAADSRRSASIVMMVGLSITAGLTLNGVATSYRRAIDASVASWSRADLSVRLGQPGTTLRDARFPPGVQHRLARLPGVALASAYTSAMVDYRGRNLMLQGYDPASAGKIARLIVYDGVRGDALWRALAHGQVAVSQSMARLDGLRAGDRVRLPSANRSGPLTVAAVVDDYTSDGGTVVTSLATLGELSGEHRLEEVPLVLAPGASPAAVSAAVRRALPGYPSLVLLTRGRYRTLATGFIRGIVDVFRGLALAVFLIVLLAATLTLAASLSVRRRSLAVSGVCGLTPRQLASQLALEVTAMAIAAWLIGLALSGVLVPETLRAMSTATGLLPPVAIAWAELALALPMGVTISLAASALVSRSTVRGDLVDALRFE